MRFRLFFDMRWVLSVLCILCAQENAPAAEDDSKPEKSTSASSVAADAVAPRASGRSVDFAGDRADGPNANDSTKVQFNFAGANWRNVLEWFADQSGMNLDWRELPEQELNLTTQRNYTITEAQDVLNLHLLTRGFTLLQRNDVLFLVKLGENLNPAMVPRVAPSDLDQRGRYEFCKTSFPLDWMLAETAVNELQPMLSPYGRITPLTTTNRIEVMDAAVNLREIRNLLDNEQSDNSEQRLVEEFVLEHASALEVLIKLRQILGLETPLGRMSRDQMRTMREQYEYRAEVMKRLGDKAPGIKSNKGEVYLVANERKNSILANAAPDKIAIIRQAIRSLDVPTEGGLQLGDVTTMKVYPLDGADADAVQEILEDLRDIGKLHPDSRFSEDDDRQILFAYASVQDHLTIHSVMKQLAGSSRSFKVIELTNLRAAYVAQSIRTLMGGESGDDDGDYRSRWRRRSSNSNWRGFRVEADTPNNRLFLFATDAERERIEELLVKIGERPGDLQSKAAMGDRVRIIDVSSEAADEALRQLRAVWPSVGANPLKIDVPGHSSDTAEQRTGREDIGRRDDANKSTSANGRPASIVDGIRSVVAVDHRRESSARLDLHSLDFAYLVAQQNQAANQQDSNRPFVPKMSPANDNELFPIRPPSAPVTIRRGPDGRLFISSEDTHALNELEQLIRSLVPQQKPYKIFRLKYASPYMVELTLRDIFANDAIRATAPMNFVSDETTKSIMVFGAGDREAREIQELIDFYDQAQPPNPLAARKPQFFRLQHAQAESVASVLKEVYRDLLSSKDKALQQQRRGDNGAQAPTYTSLGSSESLRPQFEGMLSMGAFPESNSLIVSAPQFLMNEIATTIEKLDQPSDPTVTRVVSIDGGVNPALVAQHLGALFTPQQAQAGNAANGNGQPQGVQQAQRNDESRINHRDERARDGDRQRLNSDASLGEGNTVVRQYQLRRGRGARSDR